MSSNALKVLTGYAFSVPISKQSLASSNLLKYGDSAYRGRTRTSMQQFCWSFSRLPLFYRDLCPTRVVLSCRQFLTLRTACPAVIQVTIPRRSFASVMTPVHRVTDDLEKPALDDRSYRVIELPNKLEALLVHDPDTDKASASLNVNVGSFSDEDDMPGMAHAVEHALFMGTKKVCS